jgi:ABC-type oligopeptide transport system substrate-binding subunit
VGEAENHQTLKARNVPPFARIWGKLFGICRASSAGSVDLVVGRWAADYPDADTFANILESKTGMLGKLCGSPEVDRLIEWGRVETSPTARHSVYRQIEEIIARDALLLPLFHEQTYRFARPEVDGLALSYGVTTVDYASLRIQ